MNAIQPRKPAGVPAGGQFAAKHRPAPGYSLDAGGDDTGARLLDAGAARRLRDYFADDRNFTDLDLDAG